MIWAAAWCAALAVVVATSTSQPLGRGRRRRATAGLALVRRWWSRARPSAPTDGALADWCDDVARHITAGTSLTSAVRAARASDDVARWLGPARHALERGAPLDRAVDALASPATGCALVAPVLRTCAELGGPAAPPLMRCASTLRSRAAAIAERDVMAAQSRASAHVLTVVPAGALTVLVLVEPGVRAALTTPPGIACLLAGGVCNAIGWWWMRRIVGAGR
jgi:tight adherence protein B